MRRNSLWLLLFVILGISVGSLFFMERDREPVPEVSRLEAIDDLPMKHGRVKRLNSWFAAVYAGLPTPPLFAFPGAYRFETGGMTLGFPQTTVTPATIFGSFSPLCSVSDGQSIGKVTVDSSGDWNATLRLETGEGKSWFAHVLQGSPVTYLTGLSKLVVRCETGSAVHPLEEYSALLIERAPGERLLIQSRSGSVVNAGVGEWDLTSPDQEFRINLLPPGDRDTLELFGRAPWSRIEGTIIRTEPQTRGLLTRYIFSTENQEPILTTLWPHHRLAEIQLQPETLGSYVTQLGRMDLVRTSEFITFLPWTSLSTTFSPVENRERRSQIQSALQEDVGRYERETPPSGVYFRGTWIGGLASVLQLTEVYGMQTERERARDRLEAVLLPALKQFFYDQEQGMLVATNPEFGNEKGNDHHFHYGYYLRAGAILLQSKPALRDTLVPALNELAFDIATTDRLSARYSFLRHFSPYEGHSWADGLARFADGNNQESTSEALNAWYGLWLWGTASDNQDFADTGRSFHALELSGTRAYWFGEGNPFPSGYARPIASIVWSGKRDYATWFSGQAMHIHGIQWLPITPASEYLAELHQPRERVADIEQAHPNPTDHEWGDLFVAYLSYVDPEMAVTFLDQGARHQALKSRGLLYHTVYRNQERRSAGS